MEIRIEQDGPCVPLRRRVVRHALVGVSAPAMDHSVSRAPLAISFVIDRSGSMAGSPLELACEATLHAISRLRDTDQFAIVVYDDEVEVLMALSPADRDARAAATRELRGVTARGTTDLAAGWELGARLVAEARSDATLVRRCLLLTDGMANEGVTDPDELRARATRWRSDGVTLTTMGLGAGFDEVLLGMLADVGGGALRYVRSAGDLVRQFDEELGEALEVVARDVTLELSYERGIEVNCLSPFDARSRARQTVIQLGDLVSRQELVLLIEVTMALEREGDTRGFCVRLQRSKEQRDPPEAHALWTAAASQRRHDARDESVVSIVVDHIVAATREQALEHNMNGDYERLHGVFEGGRAALARLRSDPVVDAARGALEDDQASWSSPVPSDQAKEAFASSYSLRRSRSEDGSSRRR